MRSLIHNHFISMKFNRSTHMTKRIVSIPLSTLALTLAVASPVFAQQPPDAGQTLQELSAPVSAPSPAQGIIFETSQADVPEPGGAQVELQSVSFDGHSLFTTAQLQAVLGDVVGQSLDLAGLLGLTTKITDFYHAAGYPFARAYLPPQSIGDGQLHIEIVEGRFGQVQAKGDADLVVGAQRFLNPLQRGDVIESKRLERVSLILEDQPGIQVSPIIRPGQELGTGDLDVYVSRKQRIGGDVGVDNHGNRFSGEYRANVNLYANSPFMFGDQLQLRSILTSENLWLGSLGYSLPLGDSGLRAQVSYAHTQYELGKDFSLLDATGTAKTSTLGLSYPVLRSQKANLTLSATYQYKDLQDKQGISNSDNQKNSHSLPLSLYFDRRDSLGGGGISYGTLSWTHGRLSLDDELKLNDQNANTNGSYSKLNWDLVRLQALSSKTSVFGRFSGQWADGNLDSSEGFVLGGANGVRAYPTGEGFGDAGWLGQLEVRYSLKGFTPYAFYDAGRVKINAKPWDNGNNHRHIAGTGVGVRAELNGWSTDATVAWKTHGGDAESDSRQRDPRIWITAGYRF